MTLKEFLEEKNIPEQYVEELEDKIILKDKYCRIVLYKKMLECNMLAGTLDLNLIGNETKNDFCVSIENKIPIGKFLTVFTPRNHQKDEFPTQSLGQLLDIHTYYVSSIFDSSVDYAIVDSVESLGDIIRYGDDCDLYTILR